MQSISILFFRSKGSKLHGEIPTVHGTTSHASPAVKSTAQSNSFPADINAVPKYAYSSCVIPSGASINISSSSMLVLSIELAKRCKPR